MSKARRDASGGGEVIAVLVEVESGRAAALTGVQDYLDLAGAVEVPVAKGGAGWSEVIRLTRTVRANRVASFDRAIDRVRTVERVQPGR